MNMGNTVDGIRQYYERGMTFLFRLVDECPDDLWGKKGGGFFFWQQVYHAFFCIDYFLLPPGEEIPGGAYGRAAAMLSEDCSVIPPKEEIRAFGMRMKEKADAWIDSLNDGSLGMRHEGMSARKGAEMSNGAVFASLCGHNMYHVGCLDSVLRENGLKGVY